MMTSFDRFRNHFFLPSFFCFVFAALCITALSDQQKSDEIPVITETFQTDRDEGDNVDSPTVWHGPEGQHWLLATAKEGDAIIIYDAVDGSFVKRFGSSGSSKGNLDRPNGIAIIDDLALVVERNNKRIQVFRLPGFKSLGSLTHEDLRLPYGLTVDQDQTADSAYALYVTDNYNPALEGYPPQGELDERIHQFKFTVSGDSIRNEHVRVFGDIRGEGVLSKVESLFLDREHNRLLIADEAFNRRNIKVYDPEGSFTDTLISDTYFESEPEGIALYKCTDGSGLWIMTDQHENDDNKFLVFDRKSLEYLGAFKGKITRNTDGIWVTERSFGNFERGAFYAVHNDGSVTGMDWAQIAQELNLSSSCVENN
jgi:3-phytase